LPRGTGFRFIGANYFSWVKTDSGIEPLKSRKKPLFMGKVALSVKTVALFVWSG
jgi:hypothetical protein